MRGAEDALVNVGDFMVVDKSGDKKVVGNVSDKEELVKAGYYKEKDWNEYQDHRRGQSHDPLPQ